MVAACALGVFCGSQEQPAAVSSSARNSARSSVECGEQSSASRGYALCRAWALARTGFENFARSSSVSCCEQRIWVAGRACVHMAVVTPRMDGSPKTPMKKAMVPLKPNPKTFWQGIELRLD